MTRIRAAMVAAAVASALVATCAHAAPVPRKPASFTRHQLATAAGTRDYWVYVPPGTPTAPRPMVVFLHGCNETAQQTADASHFDTLAAKRGFVVVYPQQNVTAGSSAPLTDGNGVGCWNWFLPEDQQRDAGEPAIITAIARQVAATEQVDTTRIYVEGVSAGADMAVILGAVYPDVYAAVGAIAGCSYRTCSDPSGVLTNQAMGAHARVVPMFIENGTADTLNNMGMASGLLTSWLGADDLADDGSMNGSVSRTPASTTNYAFDQTPQPGSGDVCLHNNSLTCPGGLIGFQGSYPYTVATYDDAHGCDVAQFWAIHFMEHAHPDASGDGPYTDPLGPDVTTASYDFFSHYALGKGATTTGCGS